jgi:hypothetical protein
VNEDEIRELRAMLFDIVDSPGILSQNEKILLSLCVAMLPENSTIVELGTGYGGSAQLMLTAGRGRVNLYSIDIENRIPQSLFEDPAFTFFCGTDRAFMGQWDGNADFIFMDAGHSFKSVYMNYQTLSPILGARGLIGFHDVDMEKIGTRVFVETLIRNGNLKRPIKSDSLLVAENVGGMPLPDADAFAETVINLSSFFKDFHALDVYRKPSDCFQDFRISSGDARNACFIGRGKRGGLVRKFLGLSKERFMDSRHAKDPEAKYMVCSDQFEIIRLFLVNRKHVPARNIVNMTPLFISAMIKDDIIHHDCAGIMRTVDTNLEKQIYQKAFGELHPYQVEVMHETGLLHMFFTQYVFEYPLEF